jgi:hypothetical protein
LDAKFKKPRAGLVAVLAKEVALLEREFQKLSGSDFTRYAASPGLGLALGGRPDLPQPPPQ